MKIQSANFIFALLIMFLFGSSCVPDIAATGTPNNPSLPAAVNTPTPAVEITPEPGEEILLPGSINSGLEILFWHPWSGKMANLIDEIAAEYNIANKWNVYVTAIPHSDERILFHDIIFVENGQILPDIIAAPGYMLQAFEQSGLLMSDLNPYLESDLWGIPAEETSTFLPIFWSEDIYHNRRLGVPAYRSGHFLFYNQTWAEELGFLDSPETAEGFREQICAAAQVSSKLTNQSTGGWVYEYESYTILSWLRAFGGSVLSESMSAPNLNNVANIDGAEYLYDLYFDNCAWIGKQQQPYEYFTNRLTLSYSGRMEDIFIQEQVNELNQSNDRWVLLPYPAANSDRVVVVEGVSYAIITSDEQKALAAWDFIRWMLKPENQARFVETSGSFPLSTSAVNLLSSFRSSHPVWDQSLDYLPLVQTELNNPNWVVLQDILADIGWRLYQYTTVKEDIPIFFQNAEVLISELEE